MRLLPVLIVGAAACGFPSPQKGEVTAPGAARAVFELRARHTDRLRVPVTFPADDGGNPVGTALPGVVLIQGGAVGVEDYFWLSEALAQHGFVVAQPEHPADLAIFAIDNGRFARGLLASPPAGSALEGLVDPARMAVAGHSLGGVVAVKLALQGGFGALAMLASFPDGADDDALTTLSIPSLSLAARDDCSAPLSEVQAGFRELSPPAVLVTLDGMTHYQFTDSDAPDRDRGCAPSLSLDVAHARTAEVLTRFLAAGLGPEGTTGAEFLSQVPGAEVTVR